MLKRKEAFTYSSMSKHAIVLHMWH